MKTVYGCVCLSSPAKLTFDDEVLHRIADLQKSLEDFSSELLKDEHVSVEFSHGPVLKYDHDGCTDDTVFIKVTPKGTLIEAPWEEGIEDLLGYGKVLEEIPDLFFSEDIIRQIVNSEMHHTIFDKQIQRFLQALSPEHKVVLDKLVASAREKRYRLEVWTTVLKMITKKKKSTIGVFKLGLDYHGVLDHDPEFFRGIAEGILKENGEIHILTGCKDTPQLKAELEKLGVPYTHLFSISSYHEKIGTHVWEDTRGPWMDEETSHTCVPIFS